MFDQNKLQQVRSALNRVFAMPITRCTFREVQNVLFTAAEADRNRANAMLEVILSGDPNSPKAAGSDKEGLKKLIDEFSIRFWVAKDVFEKGEFLALLTSDQINVAPQAVLSNRLRRVDGEEYHFVSDVETTLHVVAHFLTRLQELSKTEGAAKSMQRCEPQISQIKSIINGF